MHIVTDNENKKKQHIYAFIVFVEKLWIYWIDTFPTSAYV